MNASILYPLAYLLLGLGLGKLPFDIKGRASALLTKIAIPVVIIYNIATSSSAVFVILGGMVVMMSCMLLLSRLFTKDPVLSLCFFYLNIGWLGLPIASTMFGDDAARVLIAAYVGSSLFGNTVGIGMLAQSGNWRTRVEQTLRAPPVWALLVGLACIPLSGTLASTVKPVYDVMKFLMGLLGMAVLGIWLSETKLKITELRGALVLFACRLATMFVLISVFVVLCQQNGISLVTENTATLFLLCFLPPAANIIVLETHYLKSGRSAGPIAWGTCLSIVAIGIYVCVVLLLAA